VNLPQKVQDLMQITKLYTVFDILNDEAVAVRSFTQPPNDRKHEKPSLSRVAENDALTTTMSI